MPSRSTSPRSMIAERRSTSCSISATVRRSRSGRAMRAEQGSQAVLQQVPAQLAEICRVLTNVASGSRGRALIDDLRVTAGGTTAEVLWQALFADCLRVTYSAAMADGLIENREIEALYEMITAAAARYAAGQRAQYGEFT